MKNILKTLLVAVFLVGCSNGESKTDEKPTEQAKVEKSYGVVKKEVTKVEVSAPKEIDKTLFGGQSSLDYFDERCASCHGRYGEQKALSASKVINACSSEEIEKSLTGYRNGTHGGNLKDTMAVYVQSLSDDEIKELARLIPTL